MATMDEKLDFSRKGVIKIYEKMQKGTITDDDLHEAAANSEKILREAGVDLTVRYMGTPALELERNRIIFNTLFPKLKIEFVQSTLFNEKEKTE